MSFDLPALERKQSLHALLLSTDQEVEARKHGENERGERPFFETRYTQGDRAIVMLGTRHTSDKTDLHQIIERYHQSGADILLHEGRTIRDIFPGMTDDQIRALPASEVAKRQEQAFLVWTAFCEGKPSNSWDYLPMSSQLIAVANECSIDDILGWVTAAALGKLYQSRVPPSRHALEEFLGVAFQRSDREPLERNGFDFSSEALDSACRKYIGYSIDELERRWTNESLREDDESRCHRVFDPAYPGATNEVLRRLNVIRDRHAIDTIAQAKNEYQTIFVAAGGSHVRTWDPAIAELYK